MKALPDNKSVYTRKGITFPNDAALHQEWTTPPHARRLDGWSSAEPHKHTRSKGKISESLFVLLQRWTGQAWAVTLEHPWLHSFLRVELGMTRTSAAECPGHAAVENVIANAHLASVASAKQSKTHSTCSTRSLAASQPRSLCLSQRLTQPFCLTLFASR